jgi:hypothetical protein
MIMHRALPSAVLFGVLGLALAACGGSSPATSDAAPQSAGSAANPGPPGTTGTISAVAASSLVVQNARSGQVTIDFSGSTAISRTATGSASDVAVGDCVAVMSDAAGGGAPATNAGPVAASTVTVTPAAAQGCRPGMGMGAGGAGARPGGGARPSGANGAGGARRPRGTFGTVSAVSASGFTVQETSGTATVTTSPSTAYLKTQTADKSVLVVGQCATAVGQANGSGPVKATAISVRAPGPNGCAVGGGRQGMGGGQGAGNS